MNDLTGAPTSTCKPSNLEAYARALHAFQSHLGDAAAILQAELQTHPDFILGHLFYAITQASLSERRFLPAARESLTVARTLASQAHPRELGLLQAVESMVQGRWQQACCRFDQVLQQYPQDMLAMHTAHVLDFYQGDAINLRNRPARVIGQWDTATPHYPYLLGMLAFGHEECNQYEAALRHGYAALELEPKDSWAIHAIAHVHEMRSETAQGQELMQTMMPNWAPGNGFAFHNWWHLGLFLLDQGHDDQVLDIVDQHIMPKVEEYSLGLLDATAMLWRLQLVGVDVDSRMQRLANRWADKISLETGYYAFNDFHAAISFIATDRHDELQQLAELLQQQTSTNHCANSSTHVMMNTQIGMPLVNALQSFQQQDYTQASQALAQLRDRANCFGGSHAQRDIITLTALKAGQRAGNSNLVSALVNERGITKPNSRLFDRLLAA